MRRYQTREICWCFQHAARTDCKSDYWQVPGPHRFFQSQRTLYSKHWAILWEAEIWWSLNGYGQNYCHPVSIDERHSRCIQVLLMCPIHWTAAEHYSTLLHSINQANLPKIHSTWLRPPDWVPWHSACRSALEFWKRISTFNTDTQAL